MPKQLVEIDVPDGKEVHSVAAYSTVAHVSFREAWQWPPWIKSGTWLVKDRGEQVFLTDSEPTETDYGWYFTGAAIWINPAIIDFTPPLCDDWKKSKRQKP